MIALCDMLRKNRGKICYLKLELKRMNATTWLYVVQQQQQQQRRWSGSVPEEQWLFFSLLLFAFVMLYARCSMQFYPRFFSVPPTCIDKTKQTKANGLCNNWLGWLTKQQQEFSLFRSVSHAQRHIEGARFCLCVRIFRQMESHFIAIDNSKPFHLSMYTLYTVNMNTEQWIHIRVLQTI